MRNQRCGARLDYLSRTEKNLRRLDLTHRLRVDRDPDMRRTCVDSVRERRGQRPNIKERMPQPSVPVTLVERLRNRALAGGERLLSDDPDTDSSKEAVPGRRTYGEKRVKHPT